MRSWIQDIGSRTSIHDPGFASWLQDARSRAVDPGHRILHPGSIILDPRSRTLDCGSSARDYHSVYFEERSTLYELIIVTPEEFETSFFKSP